MTATIARILDLAQQVESLRTGYDQGQRWAWLGGQPTAGSDPSTRAPVADSECDCSTLCLGLAWLAGYAVDVSGTAYTGNAETLLRAAGFSATDTTGWTLSQLTAEMRPGDMLLGPGHIVLVGTDRRLLSAESDERGKSTGGSSGDQTGREVYWRSPYARKRGWTRLLRPPDGVPATAAPVARGSLLVDGKCGPDTKRALQRWLGVATDGVIGVKTIKALQARVGTTTDGILGPKTIKAVQVLVGTTVDGKWGPKTTRALQQYLNTASA